MADEILVKGLTPGKTYVLEQVGGQWTKREVQVVGGGPTAPNPPPQGSELSKRITDWTKAISPATAPETVKALILTTRAIRTQVERGKTQPLDVWGGDKVFSTAYDVIIGAQDETDRWKTWRKNHTDEVIRQTQDPANGLKTKAQVMQLLADTEAGLQGYLDTSGLLDKIDFRKVIRIVSLLIRMKNFDITVIFEILEILKGEAAAVGQALTG